MANKQDINWFDNRMKDMQNQFYDLIKLRERVNPSLEAFKIIIIYVIAGGLWVLLSDKILEINVKNADAFIAAEMYKGWIFIAVTGAAFYFIISNKMKLFRVTVDEAFRGYEELSAVNEELIAMEEELRQQYDEIENHRNALMVSDQRYELAVEGANDGIWDWDLTTGEYFFSIKWKKAFGYNEDELPNTLETWKQLLHPEDRQRAEEYLQYYLAKKSGVYENTYRFRSKDGKYRLILSRGKGVWDNNGKAIRIAGSHTDITEQIELEKSLQEERELSENIIHDAYMIIIVSDEDGKIVQFNPYAEKITGYKEEEVLGKNANDLFIPESKRESIYRLFGNVIKGELMRNNEIDILCKNGEYRTILWNNNLLHDEKGNIKNVVLIGTDISERRNMEKRLHVLAYYDQLTKLLSRTMFEEEGEKLILKAKEENKKIALIYLDIDNFRHINNIMGHAIGDNLLVHIANILSNDIRYPNLISRLGGDEFAILLVDIETVDDVVFEINRILTDMRKSWILDNQEFFISVSIGVAIYPDHGMNLGVLMQDADTAMVDVKESGKDGFRIYDSRMREKAVKFVQMSNQLRTAINNQEFLLYYQPQIDLLTNKVIGVEALIRWIHPEKGFIPPMEFIPFAEETGFIDKIEELVFETACHQKEKWKKQGYSNIKISVNLSGKVLNQEGLVPRVKSVLQKYKMKNYDIELEITETAAMEDLNKSIKVLNQLKELGVTISLDDFGTGYSSLTYLQKLPIDILKVDREFIKNIVKEDEESYIFESIVGLAHNLGLKVVAEGVETKEQLAFLRKNKCDIGQGYYYSRPVPPDEIEKFFEQYQ